MPWPAPAPILPHTRASKHSPACRTPPPPRRPDATPRPGSSPRHGSDSLLGDRQPDRRTFARSGEASLAAGPARPVEAVEGLLGGWIVGVVGHCRSPGRRARQGGSEPRCPGLVPHPAGRDRTLLDPNVLPELEARPVAQRKLTALTVPESFAKTASHGECCRNAPLGIDSSHPATYETLGGKIAFSDH